MHPMLEKGWDWSISPLLAEREVLQKQKARAGSKSPVPSKLGEVAHPLAISRSREQLSQKRRRRRRERCCRRAELVATSWCQELKPAWS